MYNHKDLTRHEQVQLLYRILLKFGGRSYKFP